MTSDLFAPFKADPKLKAKQQAVEFQINYLFDMSDELTAWEQEFVEGLHPRILKGYPLTPKQEEVLEKTFQKY